MLQNWMNRRKGNNNLFPCLQSSNYAMEMYTFRGMRRRRSTHSGPQNDMGEIESFPFESSPLYAFGGPATVDTWRRRQNAYCLADRTAYFEHESQSVYWQLSLTIIDYIGRLLSRADMLKKKLHKLWLKKLSRKQQLGYSQNKGLYRVAFGRDVGWL